MPHVPFCAGMPQPTIFDAAANNYAVMNFVTHLKNISAKHGYIIILVVKKRSIRKPWMGIWWWSVEFATL